jgi:hypothetical protein
MHVPRVALQALRYSSFCRLFGLRHTRHTFEFRVDQAQIPVGTTSMRAVGGSGAALVMPPICLPLATHLDTHVQIQIQINTEFQIKFQTSNACGSRSTSCVDLFCRLFGTCTPRHTRSVPFKSIPIPVSSSSTQVSALQALRSFCHALVFGALIPRPPREFKVVPFESFRAFKCVGSRSTGCVGLFAPYFSLPLATLVTFSSNSIQSFRN